MKTSEQILVREGRAGPYRSLDLESRRRRAELAREIYCLERFVERKRRREYAPVAMVVLFFGETAFLLSHGFSAGGVVSAMAVLLTIGWMWGFPFYLDIRYRRINDPIAYIKQRRAELAELPPE